MSADKQNRCWPGYEPVPGKKPNSQGSCRPKPDSKSTPSEKQFKAKRKRQLDAWQTEGAHPRRQAAQHLQSPDGEPSSQKGAAKKATASPKRAVRKSPAKAKRTTTKKSAAKSSKAKRSTSAATKRSRSSRKRAV